MDKQLKDVILRLERLESVVFQKTYKPASTRKGIGTLAEVARLKALSKANGQEKITAIVGFYEKIAGGNLPSKEGIRVGWTEGKFAGKYNSTFIDRADGDLIRDRGGGLYDLTQRGEDFFQKLLAE